jgi:hypothetical protein
MSNKIPVEIEQLDNQAQESDVLNDDLRLVEMFRNGDRIAYDRLGIKYQNLIINLCVRLMGNRADGEDAPLPPQERGIPSIEKSVESMDFDKKMSKQEEMSGTSVDKSERQVNNEIPAAKSNLMCNKKVSTRSEVAKQKGDDAVVAEQKPASPVQSPSVPATVHENQSLQSASGSDMKEMPPAAVPSEKQMSEDNNYAKKTEEIQKKILSLESKRAHFKSSGSSYRGEVSKSYLPDEDILSINEDITALLLHCRMKWTVIDSVSGVKTYSANGTVRSVELFLKKIKGRSDIKILKTVPEDYKSVVDNVIVEFTVFKR